MDANIGIEQDKCREIATDLFEVLEKTYDLYTKTQNYHWNIAGKLFFSFHEAFEKQYKDLANAVDDIAERIRTIGFSVTGSYFHTRSPSPLKKEERIKSSNEMILDLLHGHEELTRLCRDLCFKSSRMTDFGTEQLVAERIAIHEKTAWMLRSILID